MLITKEHQEQMLEKYMNEKTETTRNFFHMEGFVAGMEAMFELINQKLKEEKNPFAEIINNREEIFIKRFKLDEEMMQELGFSPLNNKPNVYYCSLIEEEVYVEEFESFAKLIEWLKIRCFELGKFNQEKSDVDNNTR